MRTLIIIIISTFLISCSVNKSSNTEINERLIESFEQAPNECMENGYEWVDLGLPSGLKWATCNVGATKPEEYGNYYAWGETEPKTTYTFGVLTSGATELIEL